MSALPKERLTLSEFLTWASRQPQGRYELLDGLVVAMAPELADHVRTKLRVARVLGDKIKQAGLDCEAFVEGLAVAIDERTSFEPDALVNCGPAIPANQMTAPQPVIVIEVLSPSTQHIDKTRKLAEYFRVPSLHHYVILDIERRAVVHHKRAGEALINTTIVRQGRIALDPPGLMVGIDELLGETLAGSPVDKSPV